MPACLPLLACPSANPHPALRCHRSTVEEAIRNVRQVRSEMATLDADMRSLGAASTVVAMGLKRYKDREASRVDHDTQVRACSLASYGHHRVEAWQGGGQDRLRAGLVRAWADSR